MPAANPLDSCFKIVSMYRQFVSTETSLKLRFEQLTEEFEEEKAACAHLNQVLEALKQDVANSTEAHHSAVESVNQLRFEIDEKQLLEADTQEMKRLERLAIVAYLQVLETVSLAATQIRFVGEHCALPEELQQAFASCSRFTADLQKGFSSKRVATVTGEKRSGERRRSRIIFPTELDTDRDKAMDYYLHEVKPYFSLSRGEVIAAYLKAKPGASQEAEEFATTATSIPVVHWLLTPELVEEHIRSGNAGIISLLSRCYDKLRVNLVSLVSSCRNVLSLLRRYSKDDECSIAHTANAKGVTASQIKDLLSKRCKLTSSQKEKIRERISHTAGYQGLPVTPSDSVSKQELGQSTFQKTEKTQKCASTMKSLKIGDLDEEMDENVSHTQRFLTSTRMSVKQPTRPMTEQALRRPDLLSPKVTRAQYVRNAVLSIDKSLSRIQSLERKIGKQHFNHRHTLSLLSPRWSVSRLETRASLHSRVGSALSSPRLSPTIQLIP